MTSVSPFDVGLKDRSTHTNEPFSWTASLDGAISDNSCNGEGCVIAPIDASPLKLGSPSDPNKEFFLVGDEPLRNSLANMNSVAFADLLIQAGRKCSILFDIGKLKPSEYTLAWPAEYQTEQWSKETD